MTRNLATKPNSLHLAGDATFGCGFGILHSVTPIVLSGHSHRPHIAVRFRYGLTIELDATTAIELARRLPEAVAKLPYLPNLHDAVVDE